MKIIPPRFDIEDSFKFDYNEMFNYKQNKKFNKLYSLAFNHSFSNDDKNKKYQRFIEIYDEDLMNGNIEIINNIFLLFLHLFRCHFFIVGFLGRLDGDRDALV